MSASEPSRLRCRPIEAADIAGVMALLKRHFPHRDESHWVRVFGRLETHRTAEGFPRYGYLAETGGQIVGAVLTICTACPDEGPASAGTADRPGGGVRVNVSGWCTDEAYRAAAAWLSRQVLTLRGAGYLNVSPARNTWPLLQAQGCRTTGGGRLLSWAWTRPAGAGVRIRRWTPDDRPGADIPPDASRLLHDHLGYGCDVLVAEQGGVRHPFVFVRRRKHGWIPFARLVYARSVDDYARFASPLGRWLLWHGLPLVFVDTPAPLAGVAGHFAAAEPMFYKGEPPPRPGNLAYTEIAMFGV